MNEAFNLFVDDKKFVVTKYSIKSFPGSLLDRLIEGYCVPNENKYVIKNGNDIIIDRDPKSFAYVVNYLRNYEVNLDLIDDVMFKKKVIDDLDYFELYCNYDRKVDLDDCINSSICNENDNVDSDDIEKLVQMIDSQGVGLRPDQTSVMDPNNIQHFSSNPLVADVIKAQNKGKDNKDEESNESLNFSEEETEYEVL
jgi:hypothetical protein